MALAAYQPNNIPENGQPNDYEKTYIRRAIKHDMLEKPDPTQMNGYREVCEGLYQSHQKGGRQAALSRWENHIQKQFPGLARLIQPPHRFDIIGATNMMNIQPPRFLYQNEIIESKLHVLYASSGVGKSFLAVDYAFKIAQVGHEVIYCAAEGFSGYPDRIAAWCNHHACPIPSVGFLREEIPLLDRAGVEQFIYEMEEAEVHPKLIIMDTLAMCMIGGDENSARDMGMVIENCLHIIEATGAAILLVHHTGKAGTTERGSSALRGAAEIVIRLNDIDGAIEVTCEKSKDTEPFETRYLKLIQVAARPGQTSCVLIPSDRVVSTPSDRLSEQQRRVLEFLALPAFKASGAKSAQIKNEVPGISHVYRVLSNLKDRGYVNQDEKGDPFTITAAGLDKLK